MDPRKVLGVSADATLDEIQKAYRLKAKKHHPDMGGDAWAFEHVQEAYQALINPAAQSKPKPQTRSNPQPSSNPQATARPKNRGANKQGPNSSRRSSHQPANRSAEKTKPKKKLPWYSFFVRQLPLQNETTVFILVNVLDIFMTHRLLSLGGIEANPIANFFIRRWGFKGAIGFKLMLVATVCVIAQIVATKKLNTAKRLLIAGIVIVSCVVIYSIRLYMTHF